MWGRGETFSFVEPSRDFNNKKDLHNVDYFNKILKLNKIENMKN